MEDEQKPKTIMHISTTRVLALKIQHGSSLSTEARKTIAGTWIGGRGCEEHTAKSVAVAVDASEVVEHAVARTSKPEG